MKAKGEGLNAVMATACSLGVLVLLVFLTFWFIGTVVQPLRLHLAGVKQFVIARKVIPERFSPMPNAPSISTNYTVETELGVYSTMEAVRQGDPVTLLLDPSGKTGVILTKGESLWAILSNYRKGGVNAWLGFVLMSLLMAGALVGQTCWLFRIERQKSADLYASMLAATKNDLEAWAAKIEFWAQTAKRAAIYVLLFSILCSAVVTLITAKASHDWVLGAGVFGVFVLGSVPILSWIAEVVFSIQNDQLERAIVRIVKHSLVFLLVVAGTVGLVGFMAKADFGNQTPWGELFKRFADLIGR